MLEPFVFEQAFALLLVLLAVRSATRPVAPGDGRVARRLLVPAGLVLGAALVLRSLVSVLP